MVASSGVRRNPHSCPPIGHAAGTVIFWAGPALTCASPTRAFAVAPGTPPPDSGSAFCLTGGNLRASVMAEQYLAVIDDLAHACETPGPFLYAVSARGLRRPDL